MQLNHRLFLKTTRAVSAMGAVVFLCSFFLSLSVGYARILEQLKNDCEGGGQETWTRFEDDCNGGEFVVYVDCAGRHHFGMPRPDWATVGTPGFSGAASVTYPYDFWSTLHMADWSKPGADIAYAFAAQGTLYFRTPFDDAEQRRVEASVNCSHILE